MNKNICIGYTEAYAFDPARNDFEEEVITGPNTTCCYGYIFPGNTMPIILDDEGFCHAMLNYYPNLSEADVNTINDYLRDCGIDSDCCESCYSLSVTSRVFPIKNQLIINALKSGQIKTSDDIMNIINNDPNRPFGIKLIKI